MINLEEAEYPYYKLIVNKTDIKDLFQHLKKIKLKKLKTDKLALFKVDYYEDVDIYKLTDYFTEDVRVKCIFGNSKNSPYQYFNLNRFLIVNRLGTEVPYETVDDYIYNNIKICSNFPITVSLEVYKYFKAVKVLDFSSGWGDRLISAMAYGCEYTGVDPNSKLQDCYKEMISFFKRSENKYKVIKSTFENFQPPQDYFDLVFTSPPFFDLEKYSNEKTQSFKKFNKLSVWKKEFLYNSLYKSVNALISEGHLAIYISDYKNVKIVEDMLKYMKTNKKVEYLGELSWIAESYPKNIFVWKKI